MSAESEEVWECGPHANAWNGHDARCRRVPMSAEPAPLSEEQRTALRKALGNDVSDYLREWVVEPAVERMLAATAERGKAEGREEEREAWASWLEGWIGAAKVDPPTPEAILRWLRNEVRPFGRAARGGDR